MEKSDLPKVRTISVEPGDAFAAGSNGVFVVIAIENDHAVGLYTDTGRRSRIRTLRLQREYSRLGELKTRTAADALARIEESERAFAALPRKRTTA